MKKYLLLLILILVSPAAYAQTYVNSRQSVIGTIPLNTYTTTSESGLISFGRPEQIIGATITLDMPVVTTNSGTWDIYITTGDSISEWDVVHFPQITADAAKIYTAKINHNLVPQTVASTGTATTEGILNTSTTGANQGTKTIAAGTVRHGPIGTYFKAYIVGSTTGQSITLRILVTVF